MQIEELSISMGVNYLQIKDTSEVLGVHGLRGCAVLLCQSDWTACHGFKNIEVIVVSSYENFQEDGAAYLGTVTLNENLHDEYLCHAFIREVL